MSTVRVDALEVIYEDDDEGAVSSNGSDEEDYEDDDPHTSLHGHPDHLHFGEFTESRAPEKKVLQALRAENKELRSHLTVLAREVERADTELARWRARYRKLEDERDALKREFDRIFLANSERSNLGDSSRPSQYTVAYSTADVGSSESLDLSRHQRSNDTERIASILVNNIPSYESPPGIPVHRGRLRQQAFTQDSLNNSALKELPRHPAGEFNNGRLSARPLNSEALPFSPSWLGPKVPVKEGSINGKHNNVINHANYNVSPIASDSTVSTNGMPHSSNSLRPKDGSSLIAQEGRFVTPSGIRTTVSPGSTITSASQQSGPSTLNAVQPIQPPRQKSVDSLGRSGSTTSTVSNSSSHASTVSSSASPSSSQPISPTPYSPKKRTNTLVKQPSFELPPAIVSSDGFQSGALVQTLRGRAKDILEGRASPGIVRTTERNSLTRSSDVSVSIHPALVNGNTMHNNRVDSMRDGEIALASSRHTTRSPNVYWVENGRTHPAFTDGSVDIDTEDMRAGPKNVPIPNHNSNVKERPRNADNPKADTMNAFNDNITSNSVSRPSELLPPDLETYLPMANNAAFQEHVDLNRNNNLMADIFVQSKYPYTNTNLQAVATNEENGFTHSTAQLQFARALTPGSNLSSTAGLPVGISGAPLFNVIPMTNRNIISTHNASVGHSLPSLNTFSADTLSFPPETIALPSSSRNVVSVPMIPPATVRSPPLTQFSPAPVLQHDPEYGPVIVHGPLPPRHHQHGHPIHHPSSRRKREPVSVPPRHLGLSPNIPATGIGAKRTGTRADLEGSSSNANDYGW